MERFQIVARILLGAIFLIFGLNGFFHFIQLPPLPDHAGAFMGGLAKAGYFFPFLKICEIVAGVLLITGAMVPFALILLAPIIINILLFHLFLAPGGAALAIIISVLEIYLAFFSPKYSPIVKQIFKCPLLESKKKE